MTPTICPLAPNRTSSKHAFIQMPPNSCYTLHHHDCACMMRRPPFHCCLLNPRVSFGVVSTEAPPAGSRLRSLLPSSPYIFLFFSVALWQPKCEGREEKRRRREVFPVVREKKKKTDGFKERRFTGGRDNSGVRTTTRENIYEVKRKNTWRKLRFFIDQVRETGHYKICR